METLKKVGLFMVVMLPVVAIVAVVWGFALLADRSNCNAIEAHGNGLVTTDWMGPIQGCYVTEDGRTFPLDKWRNNS